MKRWISYLIGSVVGLAAGSGYAVQAIRSGAAGANMRIGPWVTGADLATVGQGARARAVVALRGLLALPAKEARYYTADVDDAGRPLDGRCSYRVTGGVQPGRWWSVTLYDQAGYLAGSGPYSVGNTAIPREDAAHWTIMVSPKRQDGHWLPTAGLDRFDLTLRTYLPEDEGGATPSREQLPSIRQESCS